MALALYGGGRASAPYRVRIALALKGLEYETRDVDLTLGDQHKASYRAVNLQRLVPVLEADGRRLTQSVAILEWLEETYPDPPLLPSDAWDRARVRAMVQIVAADIHPLNNLRSLRALGAMGTPEAAQKTWIARWICDGFAALEPLVAEAGGAFAFGDRPTLADCLLVPQTFAAERFGVDLAAFPAILAAAARAGEHPAFLAARPKAAEEPAQRR